MTMKQPGNALPSIRGAEGNFDGPGRLTRAIRITLACLLLAFSLGGPALAAPAAPPAPAASPSPALPDVTFPSADAPYTGIWVGKDATVTDDDLKQLVAGLKQQEPDPQQIVILIHGFATPRKDSAAQFATLSREVVQSFKKRGERVAVVGLQWDSDVGNPKVWLVRIVEGTLGLGDENPYIQKVALARNVGATAGRQIVLALRNAFPKVPMDVMAHSLGCDVTRNIFAFDVGEKLKRQKNMPEPTAPFAPDVPVHFNLISFAGADIDYDILYKSRAQVGARRVARLIWMTVGGIRNPDDRDLVLTMRSLIRGDRAMGNAIPLMHRSQIDAICKNRMVVFDGTNIPRNHSFLKYYDSARVDRIVDAAVALVDPSKPCALLQALDEVIHAPNDPNALVKYFDKRDLAITYYTLWRLENLVCGQPAHLADGSLQHIALELVDHPQDIDRDRPLSRCLVVRQGLWPRPWMVYEATTRLQGEAGRPQPVDDPFTMP
jgi:hypothetical protein